MSLRAALKVPKYGLFYFESDRTISIVPLKKVVKVISGDNVSKGSKVVLSYGSLSLEAEIIGVSGMYMRKKCLSFEFAWFALNLHVHTVSGNCGMHS